MKKSALTAVFLLILSPLALPARARPGAGAPPVLRVSDHDDDDEAFEDAHDAPPPDRMEERAAPPSGVHLWIGGHWGRRAGGWVWVPGHWRLPPRAHARWVPGHWKLNRRCRCWRWKRGHWR